jgi:hypothetical protein
MYADVAAGGDQGAGWTAGKSKRFFSSEERSDWLSDSPSLPFRKYWGGAALCRGVNGLGREAGHSYLSNTETGCGRNERYSHGVEVLADRTEHARTEICSNRTCGDF